LFIADPKRPIEVIAIGIGNEVNKSELDKITAATEGGAFVTADPAQIGDIFLKAISLRPGAAK
jgi:Ca-activated chloride channel homolog